MAYGKGLVHEKLEREFADYIGVNHAIAVNTGGMAIQMSLRALGLQPGDEVIHQIDTCSADAFAVMNAGCTPIFSDISLETFMLSEQDIENNISTNTKALMPVHIWGNPENMEMVEAITKRHNLLVVEDACLSLGAEYCGKRTGSFGNVGVFSFGCMKPMQAGEGGMIVTNDYYLAKELRSLRHWGDRTIEYGVRDTSTLPWNGRMSEIIAAVLLVQLRSYPDHLKKIQENVFFFSELIKEFTGVEIITNRRPLCNSAYSQVVLKIDETKIHISKKELMEKLYTQGIYVWHANFEPINSLSFFKNNEWKKWIFKGNIEKVNYNYNRNFINSNKVYASSGLGLGKINFMSVGNVTYLYNVLRKILGTK
jgi:dTDP-4-amino-4,6-dideoxygalactose transaminase